MWHHPGGLPLAYLLLYPQREWWQMNWGGSHRETCKESIFGLKGASFEVKSKPHFFGFEWKKWRADR